MNELLKEKLFSLLAESSQVTNEEMQSAYGNFIEQLGTVSQSEHEYAQLFRILNNTRAELVFIELLYQHGQGEKCLKIFLSTKNIIRN